MPACATVTPSRTATENAWVPPSQTAPESATVTRTITTADFASAEDLVEKRISAPINAGCADLARIIGLRGIAMELAMEPRSLIGVANASVGLKIYRAYAQALLGAPLRSVINIFECRRSTI